MVTNDTFTQYSKPNNIWKLIYVILLEKVKLNLNIRHKKNQIITKNNPVYSVFIINDETIFCHSLKITTHNTDYVSYLKKKYFLKVWV